jgi:hypothetical protein
VQLCRWSPSRSVVAVPPCLPLSSTSHMLLPSRHPQPSPLSLSSLAPHLQPPSSPPPSPSPFSPSPSPSTAWPSILVVDLVFGGLDRVFPKPDLLYSFPPAVPLSVHFSPALLVFFGRLPPPLPLFNCDWLIGCEDKNQVVCILFYFIALS